MILENLRQLLKEFQVVFKLLQGFPPKRACDYHIPLINID